MIVINPDKVLFFFNQKSFDNFLISPRKHILLVKYLPDTHSYVEP